MNAYHGDFRTKAKRRILIIKGQLSKLQKMIGEDDYSINIIHLNRSIQNAFKGLDIFILENHLKTCMIKLFKNRKKTITIEKMRY